jgi:hypothetical protein
MVGRNCPKHVEFYSKNKFEKLVHLVGFIISTVPIIHIHLMRISYMFRCLCTIIREEKRCELTVKTTTIMILLSMVSILQLMCQEHKYTITGTTVHILKRHDFVLWLETYTGSTACPRQKT